MRSISRREFLILSGLTLGSLAFDSRSTAPTFPSADRLGRVNVGMVELKLRPDADSPTHLGHGGDNHERRCNGD